MLTSPPHLLVLYSEVKITWAVLYGVRLMRKERCMNLLLLRREISINVIYKLHYKCMVCDSEL